MAPPPPDLIDDVTAEVFLRLPPDEPEHLFRAALVCKPWLCILCDPGFLCRYRAFHGAPPALGLLHRRMDDIQRDPPVRFASTTSMPDFPHLVSNGGRTLPLDCRHGRVLIYMSDDEGVYYLVWDPITGDRHAVAVPPPGFHWVTKSAAVLCAVEGCDHLDCHGGAFRVILRATPPSSCESFGQHMRDGRESVSWYTPDLQPRRGTLVGDGIYFTLRFGNAIVKYDWGKNQLSMINPRSRNVDCISLMAIDNCTLGFACVLGSSLCTWSRRVDAEDAAKWVPYMRIKLDKMIPVANNVESVVVGFAEGVGVIFVSTDVGLFTIQLKERWARKVDDPGVYFSVLPYMSFYTPDRGRLLTLARAR